MKKPLVFVIIIIFYVSSIAGSLLVYFEKNFTNSEKLFLYSVAAGLLGSTVYMMRGFYQNIAENKFNFR